nr:hypothetical protein [uncultured Rhodopila sp.]
MSTVAESTSTVITRSALIDGLTERAKRGAIIATIETRTDPRLKKANPFGPNVIKHSLVNCVINWRYEGAVNRQREREGTEATFEASPRAWGERFGPFVIHKGKFYVEARVLRAECDYQLPNGSPVRYEDIKPYLPGRQSSAESQGVEKEIIVRDYAVENIVGLTVDGTRYDVVDDIVEPVAAEQVAMTAAESHDLFAACVGA